MAHKLFGTGKNKSKILDTSKRYKATHLNKIFSCLKPKNYFKVDEAVSSINEWHKDNLIILISSRPSMKSVVHLTTENIRTLGIKADLVVIGVRDKAEFCRKYDMDYFIDNNIHTCESIAKNSNTHSICVNKDVYTLGYYSHVCYDWNEVVNYIQERENDRFTCKNHKPLEERVKYIIKNSISQSGFYKNAIDSTQLGKLYERAEELDEENNALMR